MHHQLKPVKTRINNTISFLYNNNTYNSEKNNSINNNKCFENNFLYLKNSWRMFLNNIGVNFINHYISNNEKSKEMNE